MTGKPLPTSPRPPGNAGVQRIIYLGGLGNARHALSPHLRSRQETGQVLRSSGIQVIELRASIIIGSGSLSFEMIRALTERLPVMICPRWVSTPAQPIAIEDVLEYLLAALDLPEDNSRIFEIGGPDSGLLRRHHAGVRPAAWTAATDDLRAAADALPFEPLAGPGHASLRPRGPEAGRKPAEPHRGLRSFGMGRVPDSAPFALREAIRTGDGQRGPRLCNHSLVRCPFLCRPAA